LHSKERYIRGQHGQSDSNARIPSQHPLKRPGPLYDTVQHACAPRNHGQVRLEQHSEPAPPRCGRRDMLYVWVEEEVQLCSPGLKLAGQLIKQRAGCHLHSTWTSPACPMPCSTLTLLRIVSGRADTPSCCQSALTPLYLPTITRPRCSTGCYAPALQQCVQPILPARRSADVTDAAAELAPRGQRPQTTDSTHMGGLNAGVLNGSGVLGAHV
jgi:hypothetical protein